MALTILAFEGKGIAAQIIKRRTWGIYSHTGIMTDDGRVYEARFPAGVTCTAPTALDHKSGTRVDMFSVTPEIDEQAVQKFLEAQVGKKYDLHGLYGFAAAKDWQDPDTWFCSELAMAAVAAGGLQLLQAPFHKVSPTHITWSPFLEKAGHFIIV